MLHVVEEVRTDAQGGNPYLQVLGVLPTLYDQRWPNHRAWVQEIADICAEQRVRLFPPIPRRQSYTTLSIAGQDYRPVAEAVRAVVAGCRAGQDGQHG
jgi:cellulose biosynthesis protein BcsQ